MGETSQDTERISAKRGALTSWRRHREGQVRTRKEFDRTRGTHILDAIGRDKLGHGENPTERGAPTNWRRHRKGHVKTWKESDRARGTHILETALGGISQDTERIQSSEAYILETASGGTSQDTERIRLREVHLPTGDGIERDKSGYGKARIERSTHLLETGSGETVRARKEYHRAKGTYQLETASGGTGQDMERIRLSERRSHSGDGIGRDKSRHGNNPTEEGHSHSGGGGIRRDFRTRKKFNRVRGTHSLETESGGTSYDTERIRPREGHSLSGDGIVRDKKSREKNPTERGVLTSWRRHGKGQVRTRKESD